MSCHHCGQLPAGGISGVLLDGLERLRTIVGKPIYVTNAYRCPEHNAAVGGVSNSQHVQGTAADIYVDGMGVWELANICKQIFDGVGEYYGQEFVHVDMRDNGNSTGVYLWDDQE
jgi:uncharacterized protein YcbK (DUF882 family)